MSSTRAERLALTLALTLACSQRAPRAPAPRDASTPRTAAPTAPAAPDDACTGVGNPVGVRLPPGFCLRPVVTGLLRPRQMALAPDGQVLVAESGPGWRRHRGRLSALRPDGRGGFAHRVLAAGLDRPHGVAWREGSAWVAEAGRIARMPFPEGDGGALTTAVGPLPVDGRHVHKTLGFAPDGTLFFSVGSASDNCQLTGSREAEEPCTEREGPFTCPAEAAPGAPACQGHAMQRGVVMRWDAARRRAVVHARGLRNNVGLAWHPQSGRLWAVENARDYIDRADPSLSDAALPHDELNELTRGGDFGWPYCYDDNVPAPEYRASPARCRAATAPARLLPAHCAPMSLAFYDGAMFPPRYRGAALVTYHGYRAEGHRVVVVPFGPDGAPSGPAEDLVSAWEERPGRPHGHLLGLVVLRDGSVLISDDGSGTIYQLLWGASALRAPPPPPPPPPEDEAVVARRCAELARRTDPLSAMQRDVIDPRCVACHAGGAGGVTMRRCDWRSTWESLARGRSAVYGPYVVPGDARAGVLLARLRGDTMGPRMPAQGAPLTADEMAAVERWVREGAASP